LGSQMAHLLVDRGEELILFDKDVRSARIRDIENKVTVIQGSLGNWAEVLQIVKSYRPKDILHLGSMLSIPSQVNPWASFQSNVCGTMHVLEAARLFDVGKVLFTSSFGTYGLGLPAVVTDDALQRPISMYGSGKVYGELLGRFYRTKFGLDFRSFRSPTIVGPGVLTPGAAQFVSLMMQSAALGIPYECNVSEDSCFAPPIYFKDAVRAVDMLFLAPREKIQTVCYNACGLKETQSVRTLESVIRRYLPDFKVTYKPDPEAVSYLTKYRPNHRYEDTNARKEWGWFALYETLESIVEDYVQEVKTRPEYFGIG